MTIERFYSAHLYRLAIDKDGKPTLKKTRIKDGFKTFHEARHYARSCKADGYNIQSYANITEDEK